MWPFKKKNLVQMISKGKKIKANGVIFHIRKLNPLDYTANARIMLQHFDTYKPADILNKKDFDESEVKKIKEHYRHVFISAVVKPKLTMKKDPGEDIHVDEVLQDWDLANSLYNKIIDHTYGKKKLKLSR